MSRAQCIKELSEDIWISEFNDTYLQKLNTKVDLILNEEATFNRLGTGSGIQDGFRKGGRLYVSASIIAQRAGSTSSKTSLLCDEIGYQSLIQEELLESWARHTGHWIDNTTDFLFGKYGSIIGRGGESRVHSDGGKYVIKEWKLGGYESFQLALDHIAIHNVIFYSTNLEILNFGRNKEGDFVAILKQPQIIVKTDNKSEPILVSDNELISFMNDLGFDELEDELYSSTHADFINADFWIADLHKENVIVGVQDTLQVVDAYCYLNTEGIGYGGHFQIGVPEEWEIGDENDWKYPVYPDNRLTR